MKGSLLWKFMYLFCALAGILAGYGVFALTNVKEDNSKMSTKENTLVREAGDGVFFYDDEVTQPPVVTQTPAMQTPEFAMRMSSPTPSPTPSPMPSSTPVPLPSPIPSPTFSPAPAMVPDETVETDNLPSLGTQWAATGDNVPELIMESSVPSSPAPAPQDFPATQTITYPAKIFGQTPVINRTDAYVSYFEFSYDLIAMMEPAVTAKGLNMNALIAKFAVKALLCGVDIEKLDINAPIPRRLAALCLWLAAQVLNESGCDTSAKSAGAYVTDISGCSSSEKKAIAYLYETGILQGYQVPGQRFYPEEGLKTKEGNLWLSAVKQRWK